MAEHSTDCSCGGTGFLTCPECKGEKEIVLALNGDTIPCYNGKSKPFKKGIFHINFGKWGGPVVLLMPAFFTALLLAILYLVVIGC